MKKSVLLLTMSTRLSLSARVSNYLAYRAWLLLCLRRLVLSSTRTSGHTNRRHRQLVAHPRLLVVGVVVVAVVEDVVAARVGVDGVMVRGGAERIAVNQENSVRRRRCELLGIGLQQLERQDSCILCRFWDWRKGGISI